MRKTTLYVNQNKQQTVMTEHEFDCQLELAVSTRKKIIDDNGGMNRNIYSNPRYVLWTVYLKQLRELKDGIPF